MLSCLITSKLSRDTDLNNGSNYKIRKKEQNYKATFVSMRSVNGWITLMHGDDISWLFLAHM